MELGFWLSNELTTKNHWKRENEHKDVGCFIYALAQTHLQLILFSYIFNPQPIFAIYIYPTTTTICAKWIIRVIKEKEA